MSEFPNQLLQQAIEALLGFSVIFADQNGPRPEKRYATIKITENGGGNFFAENGPVGVLNSEGYATRIVKINKTSTAVINLYGKESMKKAAFLADMLRTEIGDDLIEAANLSIVSYGTAKNLTALLDKSQYEERAMIEFEFAWRSIVEETLDIITKVKVGGNLIYEKPAPVGINTLESLEVSASLQP